MFKRRYLTPLYVLIPLAILWALLKGYSPGLRQQYPAHSLLPPKLTHQPDPSPRPKLTMISIWTTRGAQDPTFIPYFFRSVEKNPRINLLFLNIDESAHSTGCKKYTTAPNVRQVCLTSDEYYQHHVDFLCQHWGCSSPDDSVMFFNYIKSKRSADYNHSYFRILRNTIFARYIDPDTTIWGWCDFDEFWGNFDRVLPWDLMDQFDFIAVNNQPALEDQHLLMTRGHMAFFRNTPEMNEKLLAHPFFESAQVYKSTKKTAAPEEFEFTHYLFSNPNFTFLLMEGNTKWFGAHFLTDKGVFLFQGKQKRKDYTTELRKSIAQSLLNTSRNLEVGKTFTEEGAELEVPVKHGGLHHEKWAESPWLCFVETGPLYPNEKVYVMRRDHGGGVTYRVEPRDRWLLSAGDLLIDEALYMHFRVEKRKGYFKNITQTPPGRDEVWVHWNQREGEVWDLDGNVLRASSDEA